MEHRDFVASWKTGLIRVSVNRTMALQIAGSKLLPSRYRVAHHFWSWIWFLSIPAGFMMMYFYSFWIGLLMLLVGTPLLSKATKQSAFQFMIDHALEDARFYALATEMGAC